MAVEVIDQVARQNLLDHESVGNPHAQYVLATGESVITKVRLQSPDGSIWELTIDNYGIITGTKVS